MFKFFWKFRRFLYFHTIPAVSLIMVSFFLFKINYLHLRPFLKIHKNFSCNLHISKNHAYFLTYQMSILYITNTHRDLCSPSFVADNLSELFLHPSILLIKDSRSAWLIDGEWLIRLLVLIKLKYLCVFGLITYKTTKIFICTYFLWDWSLCFVLNEWLQFK